MPSPRALRPVRAAALAAGLPAAGATGLLALRSVVTESADRLTAGGPVDEQMAAVLVLVSAGGAAMTWGWLWLCVLVCLADLRDATRPRWRLATATTLQPRALHGMVGRAVGVAAVPALLAPAVTGHAGSVPLHGPAVALSHEQPALPAALSGLPLPDRVPGTAGAAERYRVRAGDTLWAIAADRLPPSSSDAVIDRSWRRLFAVNRVRVGSDPHLIRPGTVLRLLPGSARPRT
jgi:nucleoid-associated protein YgaU